MSTLGSIFGASIGSPMTATQAMANAQQQAYLQALSSMYVSMFNESETADDKKTYHGKPGSVPLSEVVNGKRRLKIEEIEARVLQFV